MLGTSGNPAHYFASAWDLIVAARQLSQPAACAVPNSLAWSFLIPAMYVALLTAAVKLLRAVMRLRYKWTTMDDRDREPSSVAGVGIDSADLGLSDPRAYRRLAAAAREQISSGKLRRGQPLPSITALSRDHGHARQTCSKAYRVLEAEGLVRRFPGLGYFVVLRACPARRAGIIGVRGSLRGNERCGWTHSLMRWKPSMRHYRGYEPSAIRHGTTQMILETGTRNHPPYRCTQLPGVGVGPCDRPCARPAPGGLRMTDGSR